MGDRGARFLLIVLLAGLLISSAAFHAHLKAGPQWIGLAIVSIALHFMRLNWPGRYGFFSLVLGIVFMEAVYMIADHLDGWFKRGASSHIHPTGMLTDTYAALDWPVIAALASGPVLVWTYFLRSRYEQFVEIRFLVAVFVTWLITYLAHECSDLFRWM